jgi:hypothetical protein
MPDFRKAAVMSMPGWCAWEPDLLYHPPSGRLRCGHAHDFENARPLREAEYPLVVLALIDRLQSEIRYGAPRGFKLKQRDQLNDLRHSVFVGDRAAQLAEVLGLEPAMQAVCRFLGGKHDLHEALPGIKDMHGPALRWYRSCCPEIDEAHRAAERLVSRLVSWQVPDELAVRASVIGPMLVKYADRDAMAVERAFIFRDRPGWLEQRVEIVDMVYGSSYGPRSPYSLEDDSWQFGWLDQCLREPVSLAPLDQRAPVPQSEVDALWTWYDTIALPQCSELTM